MSGPVMASLALHAVAVLLMAFTGAAPAPPKVKVYAVDIVSPPPNVEGEPVPEAMSNQEPGPASPEPDPAPAAPEPEPPAPEPAPAPPVPEKQASREPQKAPEPRRTPEREQPKRNPPAEQPKQNPPATQPNRPTPAQPNRPPATGTGSDANRSRGDGTRTGPATGRNAQANSPGGEGLNIHNEGEPCPVAGFCENVTRQVQRFFRPPAGSAGARAEVCFRIRRDGSVQEIEVRSVRGGGATFRLAAMEAAEAAGDRKAFGTLPGAFDPNRWKWCVELTPS